MLDELYLTSTKSGENLINAFNDKIYKAFYICTLFYTTEDKEKFSQSKEFHLLLKINRINYKMI